jgi:hypothetical protein
MQSPPATMACTTVNRLAPGLAAPGRLPRSMSWSAAWPIPSPFRQGGREQQPGAGDRVRVIEGDLEVVKGQGGVGCWRRKGALLGGRPGSSDNRILAAQRALFMPASAHHESSIGGSRLSTNCAAFGVLAICDAFFDHRERRTFHRGLLFRWRSAGGGHPS